MPVPVPVPRLTATGEAGVKIVDMFELNNIIFFPFVLDIYLWKKVIFFHFEIILQIYIKVLNKKNY